MRRSTRSLLAAGLVGVLVSACDGGAARTGRPGAREEPPATVASTPAAHGSPPSAHRSTRRPTSTAPTPTPASPGPSRTPGARPSPSARPPGLLSAADLGVGWQEEQQEERPSGAHVFCGKPFRSDAARVAYVQSSLNRTSDGVRFEEQGQTYRSSADAAEAVAEFREAFSSCRHWVVGSGTNTMTIRIDPYPNAPCSDGPSAIITFTTSIGVVHSPFCVLQRGSRLVGAAFLSSSQATAAELMSASLPAVQRAAWS